MNSENSTWIENNREQNTTDRRQEIVNLFIKNNPKTTNGTKESLRIISNVLSSNPEDIQQVLELFLQQQSGRRRFLRSGVGYVLGGAASITLFELGEHVPLAWEYLRAGLQFNNNINIDTKDNFTNIVPLGDSLNTTSSSEIKASHLCSPGWISIMVDMINAQYPQHIIKRYRGQQTHSYVTKEFDVAVLKNIGDFDKPGMRIDQIITNVLNSIFVTNSSKKLNHELNPDIQEMMQLGGNIYFPFSGVGNDVLYSIYNHVQDTFGYIDPTIELDLIYNSLDQMESLFNSLHYFFPKAQLSTLTFPNLSQVPGLQKIFLKNHLTTSDIEDKTWKLNFELIRRTLNHGYTFLPFNNINTTPSNYCSSDNNHPSQSGQELMALKAMQIIQFTPERKYHR